MLGGCADEGDGAHHCGGVEAGAGEEGGLEEEEGREDGGLGDVEAGPEGVFLDVAVKQRFVSLWFCDCHCVGEEGRSGECVLIRWSGKGAVHGPYAGCETDTQHYPGVRSH